MKSSAELRKIFLDYFRHQSHEIVPSGPLVPANDPTLLFTNAGMVQFKEVFLGREVRAYHRAASAQRCVRAGGKHNDLENVGYTARHHTFFEMLGNFSFGDYFKREAIGYAWELLTEVLKLPPERLWVTVFKEDDEAANIWLQEIGVSPERFSRCGAEDNFWSMGETGPCGPCSEIFYDHGPEIEGGPPGSPEQEGDRYTEIWNLVFMQYDRGKEGRLSPLPRPSVDTGMGLERLAAVMQGVHDNYNIDLFRNLIAAITALSGIQNQEQTSLRVIADHIRSCVFLIVDGIQPSNEGRGYVLRRIIRRAIRHGHKLGLRDPFFYRLVEPLVQEMGEAYPELFRLQSQVERVLKLEEERFNETLEQGLKILEQDIIDLSDAVIPGETIFRLYDTFGFPVDLTADIARERKLTLDMKGFEQAMAKQRKRARAASRFKIEYGSELQMDLETEFTGYEQLRGEGQIAALFRLAETMETVEQLSAGESGMVVLDRTPFYAEAGGQVGDRGTLRGSNGLFNVTDTHKQGAAHVHLGEVRLGQLRVGDSIQSEVDRKYRTPTRLNHSATHLLHAALREVLGEGVIQKGSLVASDRLRFDFSHLEAVQSGQLRQIEHLVNAKIRANLPVETQIMPLQQALDAGVMALFGEKYGEQVRVLRMGDFSMELCGGTHVDRTGDIGLFKIINEMGVAAGIRRIEAVTGEAALSWVEEGEVCLEALMGRLKASRNSAVDKLEQLQQQTRQQEKELQRLKAKLATTGGADLSIQAQEIRGIKVLAARIDGVDSKTLRATVDQLKGKLITAAVVLGTVVEDKVVLIAGVTNNATSRIKAGDLVNFVAEQVGGRGGGRPDMAQAGGRNPDKLDAALDLVPKWVEGQLTSGAQ
ncbi:alanyl-tRNA synthetase [Nitrosococcus oceani ATCC 19707]|uniref:Alanine--tRNA ligase n=2 Tax=Nitrosococcus oceani TaxID=1229 RepID=SYA_NITOC|nr:alanine--tRNA ligase [Nitrosococcus oceani]Q3JCK8.1 RecName: Full=Alanine--tRNA ligase; AltName: Full=Alanyl-tRNA synthetase; Short=AlaRS [Nitrosococcus oceani ATCC 19707]KFI20130.1 alanyl-tRNA synthetase [Nitrosococcus oceani C-27]ABA57438.1 alanyl-tRNA synthetase [Nitrosococcus oceani ATCC 19707]EDZ67562.1 alanyl-tRNA synthetase [Nitrosococcus oceani AFC27]GEM21439.1 alanine--tRNA ligase [Nitrosococcus oceani]